MTNDQQKQIRKMQQIIQEKGYCGYMKNQDTLGCSIVDYGTRTPMCPLDAWCSGIDMHSRGGKGRTKAAKGALSAMQAEYEMDRILQNPTESLQTAIKPYGF